MREQEENSEPDAWDVAKRLSELALLIGSLLTLEHKINYDRWYDEDEDVCHGGVGLFLAGLGGVTRFLCEILVPPKCPNCNNRMIYVPKYNEHYCKFCNLWVHSSQSTKRSLKEVKRRDTRILQKKTV